MSDSTSEEAAALSALGYSEEWLDLGVLDSELLRAQYERMQSGGSQKTARYRAEAATLWLAVDVSLDDEEIDGFVSLMKAEPDAKLAKSCIAELIRSPRIDLEQLERAARSDEKLLRSQQALIGRTCLVRQMEGGVTDEHMIQVIDSKDAAIQTSLIRDDRLARRHAELLAQRGVNPTIRERAQKWSVDKQFWKS